MVEHSLGKGEVDSSILSGSTSDFNGLAGIAAGLFSQKAAQRGARKDRTRSHGKVFARTLMVLLDRIELSTSPLPRECSTTELQQPR